MLTLILHRGLGNNPSPLNADVGVDSYNTSSQPLTTPIGSHAGFQYMVGLNGKILRFPVFGKHCCSQIHEVLLLPIFLGLINNKEGALKIQQLFCNRYNTVSIVFMIETIRLS
jgi:hypothetical protein